MNRLTDQQLLHDYAKRRSEAAFTEVVRRHLDFVYSAALRMVRDAQLAEDVTQGVFMAFARNARQLTHRPVLSGWLHRTTQNLAANAVRTEVRRRAREQEAAAMNEWFATEPDGVWEQIAPHLDAALGELSEADRDALLLRYFERKSAQEMAQVLGVSDEAAQKRVNRAVERLREFFAKRGVTVGASGLVLGISANAIQAAPVGLAVMISTSAALAGTPVATTATAATAKTVAMTTLQKTLVTATVAVLAGAGIYEAHQASQSRDQVQTLQQRQAPLTEQLAELRTANERLANQIRQVNGSRTLAPSEFEELLKLRGKAGLAQAESVELSRLKSTLAEQTGKTPDYMTNAMAMGMGMFEKILAKDAQARLANMKQALHLTEDQMQASNDIMQKHLKRKTEMTMELISGKNTLAQRQAIAAEGGNQDDEIKALLTSEQLAAYPEYEQAEKTSAAEKSARSEASQLADDFSLSKENQEQVRAALYQMHLNEPDTGLNQEAIAAAQKSGNLAEAISMKIERSKSQLEEKLKILGRLLTPQQLLTYREQQMKQIDMMAAATKMILPQTPVN